MVFSFSLLVLHSVLNAPRKYIRSYPFQSKYTSDRESLTKEESTILSAKVENPDAGVRHPSFIEKRNDQQNGHASSETSFLYSSHGKNIDRCSPKTITHYT